MRPPFCRTRRPPWWPHDEPWPRRPHQLHAYRARFFRRAAIVAMFVLTLGGWGAVSLVWLVATRIGRLHAAPPAGAFALGAGAIVAAALVAFESYERAIDSHVKNLRRKLEPDPRRPRYVLTVYGVGYRVADDREEAG